MSQDLTIGIDLGGTQLRVALVDAAGNVVRRIATRTDVPGGPASVIRQMLRLVNEVTEGCDATVSSVGISSPGPMDSDVGRIIDIPSMPGFVDVPLRETLARELALPVVMENDALSAAYGEWKHGAGQGLRHFVYITVSTGLGGGVVSDGRLVRGRRGMAGHIGHLMMDPRGPRCDCGGTGCLEALASGTAFSTAARAAGFADGKAATDAARSGNATALDLLAREAEFLGYGFASLLHLYSPERLIVGGGMSAALDLMLPTIRAQLDRFAMPAFRNIDVVRAALGDNAGLVGAAAMARETFAT